MGARSYINIKGTLKKTNVCLAAYVFVATILPGIKKHTIEMCVLLTHLHRNDPFHTFNKASSVFSGLAFRAWEASMMGIGIKRIVKFLTDKQRKYGNLIVRQKLKDAKICRNIFATKIERDLASTGRFVVKMTHAFILGDVK